MTTTFITGDRTMTMLYPGMVAVEMMRALGRGDAISTGDQDGVDAIVRALARQAEIEVGVLPMTYDAAGKQEWDKRHEAVSAAGMNVVAIHLDPQASSVCRSLERVFANDANRLTMRTSLDLELA